MKIKRWEEDLLFSSDLFIKCSKFSSSEYMEHKEKEAAFLYNHKPAQIKGCSEAHDYSKKAIKCRELMEYNLVFLELYKLTFICTGQP